MMQQTVALIRGTRRNCSLTDAGTCHSASAHAPSRSLFRNVQPSLLMWHPPAQVFSD